MSATGRTRLLIATGEAAASVDELLALVRTLVQSASEILVVTPVLVSRLRWLTSDTDRARSDADERLGVVLGHIEALAPEAATRPSAATRPRSRVRGRDSRVPAGPHPHRAAQRRPRCVAGRGLIDALRSAFRIPTTIFEIRPGRARPVDRRRG